MSWDLSVLMRRRISQEHTESVHKLLWKNGFYRDEFGYLSVKEKYALAIYIELPSDEDDWWDDMHETIKEIGFFPMTDITLTSRLGCHEMSYMLAKELARLVDGVIYDHQIGVVYNSEGEPYGGCLVDGEFEEYGAGSRPAFPIKTCKGVPRPDFSEPD